MSEALDIFAANRAESEEKLVAAISSNPERIVEVAHIVDASDFVNPFFGAWFSVAVDLSEAGQFTQSKLRTQLRKEGYLKDPSEASLFGELCRDYASGADAVWHASELARIAAIGKMQRTLFNATIAANDIGARPDEIIASTIAKLEAISCLQANLWESMGDVASRVLETHKANMDEQVALGVPTGFPSIDRITGGFFAGQLWHIAARSYMGKSTVALEFAYNQLAASRGVYFASYEMTNDELIERMFSSKAGVSLSKFTQGGIQVEEIKRVEATSGEFQGQPMFMDDRPPSTVQQLRARVKLAATHHKLSLVVVDHLGLFPHIDRRVQRAQQLVEITRDLKAMAKEMGVTVLLLNQLNADADGEKPTDKHYAESKGIIANLDVSILLHRENKTSVEMDCNITKNRKGKPDSCQLIFEGEIQRVTDPSKGSEWVA